MQILTLYTEAVADLFLDLWLYMLIGFTIAGVVEEFVSRSRLLSLFGRNDPLSLLRAVLVGFVVSTCSCGAIPLAASLRERGASTATTLAFLLAAPWLGIPMLLVYVSFLGWQSTLVLIHLCLLTAFLCGMILARLERRGVVVQGALYHPEGEAAFRQDDAHESCADESCGCATIPAQAGHGCCASETSKDPDGKADSDCGCHVPLEDAPPASFFTRLGRVPSRGWRLGRSIAPYLLIGMLMAGAGKAFVSADTIADTLGRESGLTALLVALPVSVVIEACSEGFAVVSGQLHEMGASLAVVFLMTMVGVATDFTEISVLWGRFGRRTALAYLAIGTLTTLAFSVLLQLAIMQGWVI